MQVNEKKRKKKGEKRRRVKVLKKKKKRKEGTMLKSKHRSIVDLRVNVFVFGSFVFVKK